MNQSKKSNEIRIEKSPFGKFLQFIREIGINILIIVLLGFFVVMPFKINGSSMETNYHNNEYIILNKFSYLNFSTHFNEWKEVDANFLQKFFGNIFSAIPLHIGNPNRGDVVVVKPKIERSAEFYLKRIIGLPGETIRIQNGKVFIKKINSENFIELQENYLSTENNGNTNLPLNVKETDFLIPEGKYWVMGDNRMNSSDSRNCFWICEAWEHSHFIERENIVGKIFISLGYFNIFAENKFPKLGSFSWEVKPQFFSSNSHTKYPELD